MDTLVHQIAPPIAQTVDRDSGTFGVQTYEYGPVEIASEVGWENYKRVADGIMVLLNRTDYCMATASIVVRHGDLRRSIY